MSLNVCDQLRDHLRIVPCALMLHVFRSFNQKGSSPTRLVQTSIDHVIKKLTNGRASLHKVSYRLRLLNAYHTLHLIT